MEKDKNEVTAMAALDTVRPLNVQLSEKEKLAIEAEARADLEKELKAEQKKIFKDAVKRRLKAERQFTNGTSEPGDGSLTITLDLAPAQHFICLDGARYYHGKTYTLPINKVQSINDMAFRGWKEESARLGEDMNAFYGRRKMQTVLGPQGLRH